MQNKTTLLLVVCALLLGVNIGILITRDAAPGISILPSAVAGSPTVSPRGDTVYTCSEDGTKLYVWNPKTAGKNDLNPWVAIEYVR